MAHHHIGQHGNTVFEAKSTQVQATGEISLEITTRQLDSRDPEFRQRIFQLTDNPEVLRKLGTWIAATSE